MFNVAKWQNRSFLMFIVKPIGLTLTFLTITISQSIPSFYHSSDAILTEFHRLSESNNCEGATLTLSTSEGTVPLTVATFAAKQQKQDDVKTSSSSPPPNRAMLLFGEHARELISPETALRMAQDLCGNNEATKQLARRVLQTNVITMIPIANPIGRKSVEDGALCQRVNENGVDLNRNWDSHWEPPIDPSDYNYNGDTNPGTKPFSEPETQALKKIVDDIQPTIFITVHSGTLGMYTPYAYSRELPSNDPSDLGRMKHILDTLNPDYCRCPSGAAGLDVGYLCPGTCLDYAYEHHASVSFAFEIWADDGDEIHAKWEKDHQSTLLEIQDQVLMNEQQQHSNSLLSTQKYSCFLQTSHQHHMSNFKSRSNEDCFRIFNPPDEVRYQETVSKWSEAFLKMCDMAATSALVKDVVQVQNEDNTNSMHNDILNLANQQHSSSSSILKMNHQEDQNRRASIAQPALKAVEQMLQMHEQRVVALSSEEQKRLRGGNF